ncbi:MAG: hypothetical protein N3A64_05820 [Desulfobacterota bacterium]|nr:hypothetical protein [Thermodesulfobacteriota bacterium]
MATIFYRLNSQDKIIFVNEEWDLFAIANGGEAVTSARVLYRSIRDFITDLTTRELYLQIMQRVRHGRSIKFTFRCDSPAFRRLLEMNIHPGEDSSVEYFTRTLVEERQKYLVLSPTTTANSDDFLRSCSWCKKIFLDGSWLEVEEAVAQRQIFHHPFLPPITHGICEQCYENMTKVLSNND